MLRLIHSFDLMDIDAPLVVDPRHAASAVSTMSDMDVRSFYGRLGHGTGYKHDIREMRGPLRDALAQGRWLLLDNSTDPAARSTRLIRWTGSRWSMPHGYHSLVSSEVSRLNARGLTPAALESRRYRGVPTSNGSGGAGDAYVPDTSEAVTETPIVPVFARSNSVGTECTDACTEAESVSNSGSLSVLAGTASAGGELTFGGLVNAGGKALAQLGRLGATVARATPGAMLLAGIFQPSQLGDGTLMGANDLRSRVGGTAETRVRFYVGQDAQGRMQVMGVHTPAGSGLEQIPVVEVAQSADKQRFEAEVGGITLTWTPNDGPVTPLTTAFPEASPDMQSGITVFPIEEGQDSSTVLPASDRDFSDAILVFPADSGVQPLYVVVSNPVKPLEVGTYGDMAKRSRGDGLDIDHIPSRKAITNSARSQDPTLSESDLKKIGDAAPSVAIPRGVHQKYSETYGGRNTIERQINDSKNISEAVNSNVDAIARGLKQEGFSDEEIAKVRQELHDLHKAQGRY